jgi:hypothetical protein
MKARSLVVLGSLVLAAGDALAFRDDLTSDPLWTIEAVCQSDPARLPEALAAVLGVHPLQVLKAIGRHTLASLEKGDLCARDESERRQVIAAAKQPKKNPPLEAAQPWLLREMGGATGVIDHAAVSQALDRRAEIVASAREKRAGLPGSPAGWSNLTGYTQSPGRVNHILFTSGTGNDILLGSDGGGIWRTANGGSTWTAVNDFLGSLSIINFAKAGNDANTIYAGTNARGSHTYFPFGVIKSTDGGSTWSQSAPTNPSTNADFTYVQRIAVNPTNSANVLAATNSGAYETTNGGTSWTKVAGINTLSWFVAFHPTDGNRRAIAYNDGTVRYTTTGDLTGAGASTSTVLAGGRNMKIAYAKSDTSVMYALVTDNATNDSRIFKSTSAGGAPWTEISNADLNSSGTFYNNGYLSYTGVLWVDPTNANRVAIAEGWAGFTTDITAVTPTFTRLYSGWTDFHGIVEHPGYDGTGNRIVFFMDDGGVYRVADINNLNLSGQFTRIEQGGLTVTQVYSVSGHGGNPIFGAQDTGPKVYKTDPSIGDATTRWRFVTRPAICPTCNWIGDGMTTAASTANSSVLYGSRQYLDMFRSTDGGASGTSIVTGSVLIEGGGATPSNYNASFVAPFVLDPSNQSRMLAGGQSLWRSTNVDTGNPPTWESIRGPYTDPICGLVPISVIAVAPSNPDVVWIAYQCVGRIFKSTNATQAAGSVTWTEVLFANQPLAMQQRSKASITIDRLNPNIVWVGLANYQASTLFRTTDGGATPGAWTTITGLPGAPVYSLLQHPANDSWLYAGTGVGLFASDDGGTTWSASNEGPANIVVRSLDWNGGGVSPELLVGTFGRGVFKATVSSAALAASTTALVASPASPQIVGTSVTFTATVSGSSGTPTGSVIFRDSGVDIGTVALNGSGQAALTTAALSVGSHSITANYQGSGTYSSSSSSAVVYNILATSTTSIVASPASSAVLGASVTFTATVSGASGTPTGSVVFKDGVTVLGTVGLNGSGQAAFTTSSLALGSHSITASYQGSVVYSTSASSALSFNVTNATATVALVASPASSAALGATVTFTATVSGASGTPTGNVVFFDGATNIGTVALTGGQAVFATSSLAAGSHSITASYGGNSTYAAATSSALSYTIVAGATARLSNISTRGRVLTGNDVMIAGFIIGGSSAKTLVVNVAGPSLANFGITGALANPQLTLVRSSDNAVLATNDNWQTQTNPADVAAIQASGYQPNNALEPAVIATLPPGAYTAIVSGVNGGTGVGLVGVFEVDHPEVPLINISTRMQVQTGNDVMIAGFIISGSGTQTVVVNVAGPYLANFGISNPLANPQLTLVRSSDNAVLATNDNWQTQTNPADVTAINNSGFKPNNTLEPAIIAALAPGAYTAIVSGVSNGTGVGLVGVFVVP